MVDVVFLRWLVYLQLDNRLQAHLLRKLKWLILVRTLFQSLENFWVQDVYFLILFALFDELSCQSVGWAVAEHDFLGSRTRLFRLIDNNETLMHAIE